jgi:hypothetical protein
LIGDCLGIWYSARRLALKADSQGLLAVSRSRRFLNHVG